MPGSLGIQMLKLSLCMKISIKSNIRQRNNMCYFPLKCSWHQETDLFEKSKHLLKHTSPVSDSRFQFRKLHKYLQQGLFLLQLMERTALPGHCPAEPPTAQHRARTRRGSALQAAESCKGALFAEEELQVSLCPESTS